MPHPHEGRNKGRTGGNGVGLGEQHCVCAQEQRQTSPMLRPERSKQKHHALSPQNPNHRGTLAQTVWC